MRNLLLITAVVASLTGCHGFNPNSQSSQPTSAVRSLSASTLSWSISTTNFPRVAWTDTDYNVTKQYEVSIGTSIGSDDVVPWTSVGNALTYQNSGLTLVDQQQYFISVRADEAPAVLASTSAWFVRANGANAFQSSVFLPVTGNPRDVTAADLNGDGRLDLVSADGGGSNDKVSLQFANAGGFDSAVQLTVGANVQGVKVADLLGDSNLDIIAIAYTPAAVVIFAGHGDGTFDPPVSYSMGNSLTSLSLADFNKDGLLDIAVTSDQAGDAIYVMLNNSKSFSAASKYTIPTGNNPKTAVFGDWNEDGNLDLAVVAESTDQMSTYLGAADGTFGSRTDYSTGAYPRGLAVVDTNRDGHLDLVVANTNANTVQIFNGSGTGSFTSGTSLAASGSPHAITVSDTNGDGIKDLVVTSNASSGTGSGTIGIYLGDGAGGYSSRLEYNVGPQSYRSFVADLNRDGKADVIVANGGTGTNAATLSILYGR